MASSSLSLSQKIGKMVGSGALSHVFIQYPPFRCNIPGSSRVLYDDGNRFLIVPSPNKVFSWPVARHSQTDSPSITAVDGGPVLAARFSLDGKILAIQSSDQEVSFYNRESGAKFKQLCRSRTERILGFFWTDCPTCDVVFVTSGGLELYSLSARLDSVKLVDVKLSQVSWYLYTHESRLVLLASGVQCKTFFCYQFSAGGIIRLPKFDASLRKGEASQKAVLGPEDVHVATMYGRLYCLQVDKSAMELNIFRFYRDAVVPQGMVPVYSESVAFSVVDGVLLVHQLASKVVLLYDIFTDMKAPISAPLPLLLRRHGGFSAVGSASHEDSREAVNNEESNMYGDSWVFANPDIILDQDHGIMWKIHLDLEAIAASSSDVSSLLAFLQRRRLDSGVAKQLSMTVLRSIIVEKRPLSLISEAMDVISKAYSQFLKSRTGSSTIKGESNRPPVAAMGGQAVGGEAGKEEAASASNHSKHERTEAPTEGDSDEEDGDLSEGCSKNSMEVSEAVEESDDIVEESEQSTIHGQAKSSMSPGAAVSQNTPSGVSAVSPEEMHYHVFAVIYDDMEVEPAFLGAAIVQFIRSAMMEKVKIFADLHVLLVQLLVQDERYAELVHFAHTKILEPSKEVAQQFLQVGQLYPPLFTVGLNMLKQLSAHGDYLSAILQQGRLLEALRYARQNRVEAVAPATFLELAADSHDMQKLASVMRFCLDFVPSFENTNEYMKYSTLLRDSSFVAA